MRKKNFKGILEIIILRIAPMKRILIIGNAGSGKTRRDMGGNCPEFFDKQKLALYRNVISFKKQHHQKYCNLLHAAKGIRVVTFKSRRQARKYIERLTDA